MNALLTLPYIKHAGAAVVCDIGAAVVVNVTEPVSPIVTVLIWLSRCLIAVNVNSGGRVVAGCDRSLDSDI